MTAIYGKEVKSSAEKSSSVRTGTDNFPENRYEKAATERTGGGNTISTKSKSLASSIYHFYNYRIYPKIKDKRGATRLNKILETKAFQKLSQIDEEPDPISDLEWDNLIILDACRHDIYEEVRGYKVESRVSAGSHSREFIEENFSEGDWSDTAVVTANPFYHNFLLEDKGGFFDLTGRSTAKTFAEIKTLTDIKPHVVGQEAIRLSAKTDANRLIIHFMQPHDPHLPAKYEGGNFWQSFGEKEESMRDIEKVEKGLIPREDYREGYKKNLRMVLGIVDHIVENLDGRTVITADHGELLGEKGLYAHFKGKNAQKLREVPVEVIDD